MLQLSKQLLTQHFTELGYSPLDYLYLDQVTKSLDELNKEEFDRQTLEEMVNQCQTNSMGQIKLDDIIMTFLKAESILVQRQQEIKRLLVKLQEEHQYRPRPEEGYRDQLGEQLSQAKQQLTANTINLQIIRKPFPPTKTHPLTRTPHTAFLSNSYEVSPRQPQYVLGQGFGTLIANTQTFTWMFQLTCLLLLITLPCVVLFNCFMNVMLLLLILGNLVSGYFCRVILRTWLALVIVSIAVDIVWFIIQAKILWQGDNRAWSNTVGAYMHFIVMLYGTVCFGKLLLAILLASQYNTDQSQKKIVSVFGFHQIQLSHDQVTKNLFPILNKPSQHKYNHQAHN